MSTNPPEQDHPDYDPELDDPDDDTTGYEKPLPDEVEEEDA